MSVVNFPLPDREYYAAMSIILKWYIRCVKGVYA